MIQVDNQFVMGIRINEQSDDIVSIKNLHSFKLIHESGNLLPTYELIFTVDNFELINYLNNGNTIVISIGQSITSMIQTVMSIVSRKTMNTSNNSAIVRLLGVFDRIPYNLSTSSRIFNNKSSLECIKYITSNYFNYETNITESSEDTQTWIQSNNTDKQMVAKLWLHSNIKDDLLLSAITLDGKYLSYSLQNIMKKKDNPDWIFTNSRDNSGDNILLYDGVPDLTIDQGISGYLGGYSKSRLIHRVGLDDNKAVKTVQSTPEMSPIVSHNEELDVNKVMHRQTSVVTQSINTHKEYYSAYDRNIMNLNMLKSYKAKVTFSNSFYNIKLFDLVLLKDVKGYSGLTNESSSGLWIVSKVAYVLQNYNLYTVVTLCKESMNNVNIPK